MASPSHRQAARIKLRELQRQRDRLDEHYTAIEQRAAQAGTPLERLRILYDGLRSATFAQKPLHPEVANLNALFLEGRVSSVPADLVATWLQRLERELAQGRLRAEFAHAFGRMLDEAPQPGAAEEAPVDPTLALADTLEEPARFDLTFLDQVLASCDSRSLETVRQHIRQFAATEAIAAATDDEVKALLNLARTDATRPEGVRRQARAALGSPTQIHEYAGVLTILLSNLAEWDWPEEGFARRVLLFRDRPRLFLEEDLVSALFLQLVGIRWGIELKRHGQLLRSVNSKLIPPETTSWLTSVDKKRSKQLLRLFLPMFPDNKHVWTHAGAYGGNKLEEQLRLLQAELRFQRGAFPTKPLTIVKTDLRDYYPSLPQAILVHLLAKLGLPQVWGDFLRRYLQVRLLTADGVRVVRRGVPLDHRLGDLLADYLLLFLDIFVEQQSGLALIRVVDDIYFLSENTDAVHRAWHAIDTFCQGCGLRINTEKSGSLTLGGPVESGLPSGMVSWGLLQLEQDGDWRLHEESFQRLQDWARRQVEAGGTTLQMVRSYNEALRFLVGSLGLTVQLGPGHLETVARRLAQLQGNLFGPGRGLVAELQKRLAQHVRDRRLQQGLPDALLYWPITAGGLGLVQPLVTITALRRGQFTPKAPDRPQPGSSGWLQSQEWCAFYDNLLTELKAINPDPTPNFQTLIQDFITRGSEVAGRKQVTLRPYWQWIVYTYGPPLLESLGTFRFLLTELVPLGLVFAQGGGQGETEEVASSEGGDAIPF